MSGAPDIRPTWVDVDTGAFLRNVDAVRARLPVGSRLIAVLKANAYGHGAVPLARVLDAERAAMIGVALLEEALELRAAGITLPILVFGPLHEAQIARAMDERITIGIVGPEELEAACNVAHDRDVVAHLKLDSGMGRMGVLESELPRVVEMIKSTPRLRIEAVYTHFANADEPGDSFTAEQIANFERMVERGRLARLPGAGGTPALHLANSAATLHGLVKPNEYARVGIALFTLEPVMRWRTEIMRLKDLPAGHAIGYGTTFRTTRPSRIATLPVGYADGYPRLLSNNADVLVRGRRAPVVGRVSMDLVTIDVTDIADAAFGDEVVLLGDTITAEEHAERTGTIAYEVFCRISARVPRIYK